jgi:predicted nucleic acid-binding protein
MIAVFTRVEDRRLFVSVLASIEVRSAVRRRQFAGDIDVTDAALVVAALNQETGRIIEHQLTANVFAEASGLVDRYSLRALDSLQLATAIVAQQTLADRSPVVFVASDQKLLQVAEAEGFEIWNPMFGSYPGL